MISCYDLEDNVITIFDSYKECSKWFNTSVKVLYCYISRSSRGIIDKKYNKQDRKWYRLYKIANGDEDD